MKHENYRSSYGLVSGVSAEASTPGSGAPLDFADGFELHPRTAVRAQTTNRNRMLF